MGESNYMLFIGDNGKTGAYEVRGGTLKSAKWY